MTLRIVRHRFQCRHPTRTPLRRLTTSRSIVRRGVAHIINRTILMTPTNRLNTSNNITTIISVGMVKSKPILILLTTSRTSVLLQRRRLNTIPQVLTPRRYRIRQKVRRLLMSIPTITYNSIRTCLQMNFIMLNRRLKRTMMKRIRQSTNPRNTTNFTLSKNRLTTRLFRLTNNNNTIRRRLFANQHRTSTLP